MCSCPMCVVSTEPHNRDRRRYGGRGQSSFASTLTQATPRHNDPSVSLIVTPGSMGSMSSRGQGGGRPPGRRANGGLDHPWGPRRLVPLNGRNRLINGLPILVDRQSRSTESLRVATLSPGTYVFGEGVRSRVVFCPVPPALDRTRETAPGARNPGGGRDKPNPGRFTACAADITCYGRGLPARFSTG